MVDTVYSLPRRTCGSTAQAGSLGPKVCGQSKALSTLAIIVAEFGDCRQNRRLSPKTATEFGDKLSPTTVASVDRA